MTAAGIAARAKALEGDIVAFRRDFHAHPELAWKEVETSKKIEAELKRLGCEQVRRGFGGTGSGVVADIVGAEPGPCVALRADIDALPIRESNSLPFISQSEGVMHACGHDTHAAMLLGAARILAEGRKELRGRVRLLFQPAEEIGVDSGAPKLIAEGALEGVAAVGGIHIMSILPSGVFGYRKGPLMASADIWEVRIQGRGGHGAMPHLAADPTIAVAHIISLLQTIVSREINPLESVVVSVGKVETGSAPNVIPDSATIVGNVRTTDRTTRAEMKDRMERIIGGVAAALRCEAKLIYTPIYPVTVNDASLEQTLADAAGEVVGADRLLEIPLQMGSEDFSYYGEKVPAAFGILGMGDPAKGTDKPHHSPLFMVDESVLPTGSAILASFALRFLSEAARGR